jgi:hypothetical protein
MDSDRVFALGVAVVSGGAAWFFYELSINWWVWTIVSVICGFGSLMFLYSIFLKR